MFDPAPWMLSLRARCRSIRLARGLTVTAAQEATGLSSLPGKVEVGSRRHLYLDQALKLCLGYGVTLEHLLDGWEGEHAEEPVPPPLPPAGYVHPSWEDVSWIVRRNIRHLRGTRGTPSVAESAWGDKALQSTLTRWESGEYRRMDLARLCQLARFFRVPLPSLITVDLTQTAGSTT